MDHYPRLSSEHYNYRKNTYDFKNINIKPKKLPLAKKIVLCTVGSLIILTLLVFFLTGNEQQHETDTKSAGIFFIPDSSKDQWLLFPNTTTHQLDRIEAQMRTKPKVRNRKEILLWSEIEHYKMKHILVYMNKSECSITCNRSHINTADVVVFQPNDDYPETHLTKQIWVYSSLSPDMRNVSSGIKFNWTATYNVHSTVPLIPFILYNQEGSDNIAATKIMNTDVHIALYYESKEEKDILRDKVELLKQYVKIDTYGEHGEFKNCSDNLNICLDNITANYKFYLTLENWFCKDYVSKKFFSALRNELIPIVWGDAPQSLYELLAPAKKTFLYIDDLNRNFTHLKKQLEYINNNDTEFNKYFEWRRHQNLQRNYEWFNTLCKMAHYQHINMEVNSINDWNGLSTCKAPNE